MNISTSTKNEYITKINFLHKMGLSDFNDYDNVIKTLENKYNKLCSIKTYIIAIIYDLKFNNINDDEIIIKKYVNKLSEINKLNKQNNNVNKITLNNIINVRDSINLQEENKRKYKNNLIAYITLSIFIEIPTIRFSSIGEFYYYNDNEFNKSQNSIVMYDIPFIFYQNNIFYLSDNFIDLFKNYLDVFRLINGDKIFPDLTEKQFRYLIMQIFKKNSIEINFHILNSIMP